MGKTTAVRSALTSVADALLAITLAPRCAACALPLESPSAGPVCSSCWASVRRMLPPLCTVCGTTLASWRAVSVMMERCPRCRRRPGAVDRGRAAGQYEGALREVIHAFKYEGRRSLARPLGLMMRDAAGELLDGADCAIPVPLHPWRRLRRGFNQASDLARCLDLPVVPALWRAQWTTPQAGLTAAGRRRNVRHAFRLSPLLRRAAAARFVDGRIVVIVDDVRTTGATIEACARVLRDAGVREVRVVTAAIATRQDPQGGR